MTTDSFGSNFVINDFYDNLILYVGGSEQRAREWWVTPNPSFSFNGVPRAPIDLMNEGEHLTVKKFLIRAVENM